ncbi:MAG: hypothetical protein AMXMBFR13_28710 [Phycisphaerae bacterium]
MISRRIRDIVAYIAIAGFVSVAWAQDGRDSGRRRGRPEDRGGDSRQWGDRERDSDRRGDFGGRGGPRGDFGRGGPPVFGFDRDSGRMSEWYLDRVTETYGLDDAQRRQVQQRLEEIRAADAPAAEQRRQQSEAIREQFRQLRERREAGEEVPPESWRQLGEQMRGIYQNTPLFNRDYMRGEVEKLLPPEQVAEGRQRREQREAEFSRRRDEFRQRMEQFRAQGGDMRDFFRQERERWEEARRGGQEDQPAAIEGVGPAPQVPTQDDDGDSDRRRRRDDWRQRRGEGRDNNDGESRRWEYRRGDDRRRDENRLENADPLGSWERYERDFAQRYRLDTSQRATAESILRDLLTQRKLYEETKRNDIASAQKIEDPQLRQEQLAFLNAHVERMFSELKSKLDRLPTAAQRETADGRRSPSTQPTASTQPAGRTSSGPTDDSRRESRRERSSGRSSPRSRGI